MGTADLYAEKLSKLSSKMAKLVRAVYDYADAHYGEGGWDVIAEAWGPNEIAAELNESMSPAKAIAEFGPAVSVWADRQADAVNSAF